MILKTVTALALRLVRQTDAPERPLYRCAPPCQSEIKRTLRRGGAAANTAHSRGFHAPRDVHSTRMVNDRFPEPRSIYGFEMVDARARAIFRAIVVINRKFTPNRIIPDFQQIFGDFNLNANTCDLSTAVSQEQSCEFNRNRTKRDDRGREMFFLLRMAFWLGLVLVLLPREKTPESDKLPQIGASEAVSAATAAVSDMGQFCKRQPAACEVGGQAATVIGQRAQDGARKMYQIITDKTSARPYRLDRRPSDARPDRGRARRDDTLTPDDLAVEWRGCRCDAAGIGNKAAF